ncbi:MAG: glycosyltransferase family 4 protein, partial [Gammaproteobacteria bacterium]
MNILTFSTLFPNSERPGLGIFVKHRASALAARDGINVRVIAPIPYFPPWLALPLIPSDWRTAARVPPAEILSGMLTWHPRYF